LIVLEEETVAGWMDISLLEPEGNPIVVSREPAGNRAAASPTAARMRRSMIEEIIILLLD
jgi:hypothetical protein